MTRRVQLTGSREQIVAEIFKLPGRVEGAVVFVDDNVPVPTPAPTLSDDEWNALWDQMLALSPHNESPADISRESMYSGTVNDPR